MRTDRRDWIRPKEYRRPIFGARNIKSTDNQKTASDLRPYVARSVHRTIGRRRDACKYSSSSDRRDSRPRAIQRRFPPRGISNRRFSRCIGENHWFSTPRNHISTFPEESSVAGTGTRTTISKGSSGRNRRLHRSSDSSTASRISKQKPIFCRGFL